MMMRRSMLLVLAAGALQGCMHSAGDYRTKPADAELLHSAAAQLTDVIVYDIFSPPQASRVYAYASVAAYEALRNMEPSAYRTLAGQLNGLTAVPAPVADSEYYLPLSAVHAFMTVGKTLTFSQARMDSLRAAMDERIRRSGIPAPVYARSIAYGEQVAQHVLAWSKTDHYLQTRGMPKYTVTAEAGRWVPTPPAYMDAVEPNWMRVRPFVMDSASQFRPEPPLPFDTTPGSAFFQQMKEVHDVQKTLTDDERELTAFWDCNPYVMNVQGHAMFATKKVTPGGHWIGIVAIASRKAHADMLRSAESYVRTAVALADGFISSWDEKYRSNFIRPETAINRYLDEGWEPLLQTPPFPEHTSGHSVISTAAAVVLSAQFGPGFAFVDSTETTYGLPVRSFPSFEKAAAEAAISRLYGGIHYRHSIEQGILQGQRVGDLVVARVHTRDGDAPPRTIAAGAERAPAARVTH